METNCACKMNLKEGERKEGLAEQQGRKEELSVCSHFPLSWQCGAASVTEPGQWSAYKQKVRIFGGDTPCLFIHTVVVTVCFQPSPFMATSRDDPCWGFCSFQPSSLCSCPIMHAKEHRKRSAVTSPHQEWQRIGTAENIAQSSDKKACVLSREKQKHRRSVSVGDAEGISLLWSKGATAHYSLKNRVSSAKKFLQTSFFTSNLLCQHRIGSILDLV